MYTFLFFYDLMFCLFLLVLQTSMEGHENQRSVNGQLISVPHRDTIRLLEVYVKRSLSLNDSEYDDKECKRKEKWVTNPRRKRLHSSDPSIHVPELPDGIEVGPFTVFNSPSEQPEKTDRESQKNTRKSKKNRKSSFWKNLVGFFSLKSEEKSEEEDGPLGIPEVPQPQGSSDSVTTGVPNTPNAEKQKKKILRKKSTRRRFSKQKGSLTKHNRSGKDHTEITRVDCTLRNIKRCPWFFSKDATVSQICCFFHFFSSCHQCGTNILVLRESHRGTGKNRHWSPGERGSWTSFWWLESFL